MKTVAFLGSIVLASIFFPTGCQNPKSPPAGDHGAILRSETKPVYPRELLDAGLYGAVTISYLVEIDGRIDQVHVIESTHPLFAKATIQAAQGWKYWPAITAGKPVRTLIQRTIRFDRISFDVLR